MTLQDVEYLQTLPYFLDHSDEDEVDAETIFRFLRERGVDWHSDSGRAGWLDVGTGPATKVAAVLRKWQAGGRADLPSLTLIEPSAGWHERANHVIARAGCKELITRIFPITWEKFISGERPHHCFRLVTFLHSVYGIEVDETGYLGSLASLPELLDTQGWVAFAIESPISDLYTMKKELFPQLNFRLVDYTVLESTFSHFDWDYVRIPDLPQKFYLSLAAGAKREALANTRALSFIVQTTLDSYERQLTSAEVSMVSALLDEHLKRDEHGWYLNVHDRIYWTRCKRRHAKRT